MYVWHPWDLVMDKWLNNFSAHRAASAEVLVRCDEVASFSENPDNITRLFLSDAMRRLHSRITEWMEEAGLSVRLDAAGNLIGRYDGLRPELPVLAIGSHVDTVPNAGKYDGVLGVLLGVAVIKALSGRRLPFGIDVIAFSEEEGVRYRIHFWGVLRPRGSSIANFWTEPTCPVSPWPMRFARSGSIRHASGTRLIRPVACSAILKFISSRVRCLKCWEHRPQSSMRSRDRVESGPSLLGRAGHAGTMPMEIRQDALAAAAEVVLAVERMARSNEGLRATVGEFTVEPGASNVIPESVRFSIDIRHADDQVRMAAVSEFLAHARTIADQRRVEFFVSQHRDYAAVAADPAMSDLLEEASRPYDACPAHAAALATMPA